MVSYIAPKDKNVSNRAQGSFFASYIAMPLYLTSETSNHE